MQLEVLDGLHILVALENQGYFTPRALIRAMVACVRPEPGKTIGDTLAEPRVRAGRGVRLSR